MVASEFDQANIQLENVICFSNPTAINKEFDSYVTFATEGRVTNIRIIVQPMKHHDL